MLWDALQFKTFLTRKAAREWAEKHFGYIKGRKDLRIEPHCWRMPRPVRVKVTVEEVARGEK